MQYLVSFRCIPHEATQPVHTQEVEVEAPNFAIAAQRGEAMLRETELYQDVRFTGVWQEIEES